jgi:hypothetical protein
MTDPDLLAGLGRYFALREPERAERGARTFAALTDREVLLVREAAVMGFVRGGMHANPGSRVEPPADSAIVAEVIGACLDMPDLYPTLAAIEAGAR